MGIAKQATRLLAVSTAVIVVTTANATDLTTTFPVTAVVVSGCVAVTATPLVFGTYDSTVATPLDATNNVVVTCTNGTPYQVGLNAGVGASATTSVRKMTNPADSSTLGYAMYQDAAHTINWGNTFGTDTKSDTAGATPTTYTVYGRIPASQSGSVGTYSDTITVTLRY